MKTIKVVQSGFHQVGSKTSGTSQIAYVNTPCPSNEYSLGELTKVSGLCSYQFLSASGFVAGVLITSPRLHTSLTHNMIKIGNCVGEFKINYNLQPIGLLMYEAEDSSVLLIPLDVKSPLLVEVDL